MILNRIQEPSALCALTWPERSQLAAEIRQTIVSTVKRQGGHLASNLGAVELTIAVHTAMRLPTDKLVFDVGHQAYTHKLLTGRQARFEKLRQEGGVSGFPKRCESVYDSFGTGHASTAVSAALGLARARDHVGSRYRVACVVGDGALTGGLTYEALNDAGKYHGQLLVVLNDNEMSIAPNTGGLTEHLTRLRASRRWLGYKRAVKSRIDAIPLIGRRLSTALEQLKNAARRLIVHGEFFESIGLRYLGPVDGHDLPLMTDLINKALASNRPTVLHVITVKGKGLPEAEAAPEFFHGVSSVAANADEPCALENLKPLAADEPPCNRIVGDTLADIADGDPSVVAITAAMPSGTGLNRFKLRHPTKFYDVAIAEAHAVTLAAGMAAGGIKPYVAIYATFLTRATDSIIHDVCLQRLPVTMLVDHAGLVACDGATHQGVFDLSVLRSIPRLTIWTPSGIDELRRMLVASAKIAAGPLMIRYPRTLPAIAGIEGEALVACEDTLIYGSDTDATCHKWRVERPSATHFLLAFGASVTPAREAAAMLTADGLDTTVVRVTSVKPLDEQALSYITRRGSMLATIEEGQRAGGLGGAVAEWCQERGIAPPLARLGINDIFPDAYSLKELRRGLAADDIVPAVRSVKNTCTAHER